jgi:AcrR family transcriptional regulator
VTPVQSPKGRETRRTIVATAASEARAVGLRGLTIGSLAGRTELSKSGLFGHFKSKTALQIAVLEHERDLFVDQVIRPCLREPRGEPRLQALMDTWVEWAARPGGCLFVAAASELDDETGALRDRLVQDERDWLDTLAQVVRGGMSEGHFRGDLDPDQLAFALHAVMLGYHHAARLLADPAARDRARAAFDVLLRDARAGRPR